jgi:hypothetical protein
MPDKPAVPITIDLNLDDPDSIAQAAETLGTTEQAVRNTVRFAQIIVEKADDNDMTRGQLVTSLMSVLTLMVKECGPVVEQAQMCFRLFDGLWASLELPADRSFVEDTTPNTDPLMPRPSGQVH